MFSNRRKVAEPGGPGRVRRRRFSAFAEAYLKASAPETGAETNRAQPRREARRRPLFNPNERFKILYEDRVILRVLSNIAIKRSLTWSQIDHSDSFLRFDSRVGRCGADVRRARLPSRRKGFALLDMYVDASEHGDGRSKDALQDNLNTMISKAKKAFNIGRRRQGLFRPVTTG
jgi:hypothetical protein